MTYALSDGFDLLASIVVRPNGTFGFSWDGCTGPIARASGTYIANGKELSLKPQSSHFRRDVRTFSEVMNRVRWGEREYLIPLERMLDFVNEINSGYEPRSREMGLFYLRTGDEVKPAVGHPDLSAEWLAFLLAKPVTGAVVSVLQRETSTQRPVVVVDAGSGAGLRAGMRLYATNARRPHFRGYLTILEVAEASATAVVTFQYNHIRVGDSWSTHSVGDSRLREISRPPNTVADVAKVTIYVVGYTGEKSGVNTETLRRHFGSRPLPACSLVGVQALARPEFQVEVKALAIAEGSGGA